MNHAVMGSATLIVLDRDGVINKKANLVTGQKYILKTDDIELYPDFLEFAAWAERTKKVLVVATNQQGLALDLLTVAGLDSIHSKIQDELKLCGTKVISRFYVCGHLEDTCDCRKPAPGLLLSILNDYDVPVSKVIFIGDSLSDKLAADTVDISFVQIQRDPCEEIFALQYINSLRELIGLVD
jgi:D-glycero-D-manno-heptose 1,7-bisphosphate phosphatase